MRPLRLPRSDHQSLFIAPSENKPLGECSACAQPLAPDGRTIVFVTEGIENIDPGWRARETYHILSDDEFEEIFELAQPDGEFKVCVSNRLHRKK